MKPRTAASCATRAAECRFLDGKFRESLAAAQQSTGAAARFWAVRAANRLAVEAVGHLETLPSSVELHLIRAEIAQSRNRNPEGVTEIRAALALEPEIRRLRARWRRRCCARTISTRRSRCSSD